MKKIISGDKRRKRKILKENSCSIRFQLAELARKLGANVHVTHFCDMNFRELFAAYRAHVQGNIINFNLQSYP